MAQNGSHTGSWELNYSDHWVKYINSFWRIDDETFADFLRLFDTSFMKTLKVTFYEIWKENAKYSFSNIDRQS